jgi:two-component system cell cycle sensor histidine kinase PleC
MPKDRPHIGPIAVIVASILIVGVAVYAVLMTIARVCDAHQRDVEERIVESALNQQYMKLAGMMVQQAYWDSAYDAVGETLDRKWVDANYGDSAAIAGVPLTAILDSAARPVYHYSSAATAADARDLQSSDTLAALAKQTLAKSALPPSPLTAFVRVNNTLYLAATQRIVPNDARAAGPLARHYVLAYLLPVDAGMLRGIEVGFHVAGLALTGSPQPAMANVVLRGPKGLPRGYLSWHSARPGKDFANAAAPLAIGSFLALAALQLVALRSWMQVAQRMQSDSVARTAFLANTSHELRTPLNAIIGFSECMVSEMFGPLSPRYREYAHDIKTSGQLLLGIVNDVLDLTQLNNAADIPMAPVKPGEALTGAVRMLREYAKADHISVDYIDAAGGALVSANEKALSQILLNLGSNAVKFSPPHSSIEIVLQREKDCVELVVRDNGAGIPADKLRHIGEPFYQAHQASARKPGSGLGLAIVKKLTERLGGEFAIASTVGMGTTVTVRLPQLRPSPDTARARAA